MMPLISFKKKRKVRRKRELPREKLIRKKRTNLEQREINS
jgi:hypothetical protein